MSGTKNPILKINPKFEKLIRPLSKDESEALEKSILALGCQDSIKTWKGYIIDGHNRYRICSKHNVPFKTEEITFPDESYALEMIYLNQSGRRNINDFCRAEAIIALKKIYAERAKKKQGTRKDLKPANKDIPQNSVECSKQETKRENEVNRQLAKKAGVSHDTIHRVDKIVDLATEEEKENLRKGKLSINKVYTEKQKEKLIPSDFPTGKYRIIYSNFFEETKDGWSPQKPITYLCSLPVKNLLENKAVLFLVATPAYLRETLSVMKAWGFEYTSLFVIGGQKCLKGLYVKDERHLVLIGQKDKVLPDQLPSFLMQGKDLQKLIDNIYSKGSRLDLFGKEEKKGWDTYR